MAISVNALRKTLTKDIGTRELKPEQTGKEYALYALQTELTKKLRSAVAQDADSKAIEKFKTANADCSSWSLSMSSMMDEYLIGHFRKVIWEVFDKFYHLSDYDITAHGACGPGAARLARGKDYYTKMYSSELSVTSPTLYRMYSNFCDIDPRKRIAELKRSAAFGSYTVVQGSVLSTVPKTNDISRTICTEPSLNMYLQKGLSYWFEKELFHGFRIDLEVQDLINSELAYRGSKNGGLATIDLSSASDTIGMKMLKEFLPGHILGWLELLRSPTTELPNGEMLELAMISSMGNGFTFSLETLIFACVVKAVYQLEGVTLKPGAGGNFGVFGDDIICVTSSARKVIRLLNLLGFTVNPSKTFFEGPFRESCGSDYYDGYPCRAVHLKSLETIQDRYVAINRLIRWSAVHETPLYQTLSLLKKSVPYIVVPLFENDDAGIKLPRKVADPTKERRPSSKKDPWFQGDFYMRWVAKPVVIKVMDRAISVPKGAKSRTFNIKGLYLAHLRGYIREMKIGVRTPKVIYRKLKASTGSWDFRSNDLVGVSLARLITATWFLGRTSRL